MSAITSHRSSSFSRQLSKFTRNKAAVAGAIIVGIFVVLAIFAPLIAPYDPFQTSFTTIRKPPSAQFWLGTDELGRDIFSRMIYGARASLMVGGVSVVIAVIVGVPFGLLAGYFGGWIDGVISRLVDAMLAIPFLIFAISLAAFLGASLTNAMIAIGLSAAPIFARLAKRTGSIGQGGGICGGSTGYRPAAPAHHPALYPAELNSSCHCTGYADDRGGYYRRSQPVFSRPWPAATQSFLGFNAEYRQELHLAGTLDVAMAGGCNLPRRFGLQPSW